MAEQHRALVVEDEPAMAAELCDLLASIGHEHIHVATQAEALQAIERGGFCYVLLDLQIKRNADSIQARVEAGQHLIDVLRERYPQKNGRDHCLPVIVLSGHAKETEYVVKALKAGADDFAQKPLSGNRQPLPDKIEQQLRASGRHDHTQCDAATAQARTGVAAAKTMGTIRIAVTARQEAKRTIVTFGDIDVALTSNAFCILLELIAAALRGGDGWVHKRDLGASEDQGWRSISRLKNESLKPHGLDEIIANDGNGRYRLHPPVEIAAIDADALARRSEGRVRELAEEIRQLQRRGQPQRARRRS